MRYLSSKKCSVGRYSRAFTLIEMIVALAIFSVVAVVALGALMKIISANKKAQSLLSAMTNINFALESMSREMRVGSDFYCADAASRVDGDFSAQGCNGVGVPTVEEHGPLIAFRSSKIIDSMTEGPCHLAYAYHFMNDDGRWDIKKVQQNDCTDDLDFVAAGGGSESIIDPNVIITGYYVNVTEDEHPLATIRISGYVGAKEKERTYFDVQTAVSARVASESE